MSALHEWMARITVNAYRNDFGAGGVAYALAQKEYVLSNVDDDTVDGLLNAIQANIREDDANANVQLQNGKVHIQLSDENPINFFDSQLGVILGFSESGYSGATSYLAEQQCPLLWRPSRGPAVVPLSLGGAFSPRSTTRVGRGPSGKSYSVVGHLLYDGSVEYRHLPEAEVCYSTTSNNRDFESFFQDVVHLGGPVRLVLDRDQYAAAADFEEVVIVGKQDMLGSVDDSCRRMIKNYNGLWSVVISYHKYVE